MSNKGLIKSNKILNLNIINKAVLLCEKVKKRNKELKVKSLAIKREKK